MKKPLLERFQQLAGIKPLAEISPELKARAAQSAAGQNRFDQAKKFGSAQTFGGGAGGEDSALGQFMNKTFGRPEVDPDYVFSIEKATINRDGFEFQAFKKGDSGNAIGGNYYLAGDRLELKFEGDFFRKNEDNKNVIIGRDAVRLFQNMIKIVNPESKLAKSHWASFEFDGGKVFKGTANENLNESKKMLKKIYNILKENILNESIKLSDYMEGDKFKSPLPYFVPNVHYRNKEEVDAAKIMPAKEPIRKEEGNRDQLVLVGGGKTKTYGIDNGEVADLITYEDALKKLK